LNVGLLISNKEMRNLYVLDVYMFPLFVFLGILPVLLESQWNEHLRHRFKAPTTP